MIMEEREAAIIRLLEQRGLISLQAISDALPAVSSVTLRRDLARLEAKGRLRRTHGGAARITEGDATANPALVDPRAQSFDSLILPPVAGKWAHTLRQNAARKGTLLLAESAPQVGGIYLGPENFSASFALGRNAGDRHRCKSATATVLLVALEALPNTRERVEGFAAGFRAGFGGDLVFHRVDGRGVFREAMRQALDALQTHPEIDVAFGANDHTILGAIEAAQRAGGKRLDCYSVGGEGSALFEELSKDGPLRATVALFPEVVGRIAIDASCRHFVGQDIGTEVLTPAEILTPESLPAYYTRDGDHWRLRAEVMNRMTAAWTYSGVPLPGRSVGFILHYPSHEWYRNLATAMRERSADFRVEFTSCNAEDEVAQQIRGIRRLIGAAAAAEIRPRQTILVDGGEASRFFAEALRDSPRDITLVTNSLPVIDTVAGVPGIKAVLTGGEYQATTRSLVGPSVGALLQTIRADRAVVSPDGIASGFGVSFEDERAALVCRRFAEAAREVVVLADHSVVGLESTVQAIRPGQVHAVFTDAGTLSSHRLDLSSAGIRVALADEDMPAGSEAGSVVANKVSTGR